MTAASEAQPLVRVREAPAPGIIAVDLGGAEVLALMPVPEPDDAP